MEGIGFDIGETNTKNLSQRRIRRGECPKCASRTHKMGMFGKKTPLTVEGVCIHGRCLKCYPLEGYQNRPELPPPAFDPGPGFIGPGRDIIVDDDSSVLSGITMDAALYAQPGSRDWQPQFDQLREEEEDEDDYDFQEPPPSRRPRRPEPSICGDDLDDPLPAPFQGHGSPDQDRRFPQFPQENRMGLIGKDYNASVSLTDLVQTKPTRQASPSVKPSQDSERPRRLPDNIHTREPSRRGLSPHRDNMSPVRYLEPKPDPKPDSLKSSDESSERYLYRKPEGPEIYTDLPRRPSHTRLNEFDPEESKKEIEALESSATSSFRLEAWEPTDPHFILSQTAKKPAAQLELQFIPDQDPRKPPPPPSRDHHGWQREGPQPVKRPQSPSVSHIPRILEVLNSRDADEDPALRTQELHALADLVWRKGEEAKTIVQRNHGIETLVTAMWDCLSDPETQLAAIELLFSLSACSEDGMASEAVKGESFRNAIDALLVSMQTHISVESLQKAGCGALSCLASASNEDKHVEDGTLSGAVACVVAAMDAHRKSLGVQKWGLRALYCQCVLSANAENSQMSLAKGALEAGGVDVIHRAMELLETDLVSLEWGCKLYWSLSFSDEIVGILTEDPKAVRAIMKVLSFHQSNMAAWALEEAAYGALANIARVNQSHGWLREAQIISRVFDSMAVFGDKEGLNTEACALLANLAQTAALKEAAQAYGVQKILSAMKKFPLNVDLQEEAMRALLCFSIDSEEVKAEVSTDKFLKLILKALGNHHEQSRSLQETAFALMGSLFVRKSTGPLAAVRDITDLLVNAMEESADERKLQEIVCLVLRNLACRDQGHGNMQFHFFPSLLHVMKVQEASEIVQLNSCCVLWNLSTRSQQEPGSATDESCTNQVVTVIKAHIESAAVVEMACGALWQLIAGSEERKRSVLDSGGIDFVKTALLMHPQSPPTLEMACGVLSCLSASPSLVGVVGGDQGISFVVETMRNNPRELSLLEYGSLVLRNAVTGNGRYAADASDGISTIVQAIKENPDEGTFQTEACSALWAMAAQSEDCRQKILALDGNSVLMTLVDDNNAAADAREAAHEAFKQLSRPSADDDRTAFTTEI